MIGIDELLDPRSVLVLFAYRDDVDPGAIRGLAADHIDGGIEPGLYRPGRIDLSMTEQQIAAIATAAISRLLRPSDRPAIAAHRGRLFQSNDVDRLRHVRERRDE